MKLYLVGVEDEEELVEEGIPEESAISAAKEYLENFFNHDDIEEDDFQVIEDTDNDGEEFIQVHMTANPFGDFSDIYVKIIND